MSRNFFRGTFAIKINYTSLTKQLSTLYNWGKDEFMSSIELYKDKINSMSNYIEQAKNAVSDFCLNLSALKSKILGINSSVCDNVVSSISSSSQTQEQQIAGLEATQKEVTAFIDLTVNRDNSAADAVSKAKDEFYKEYSYLKPDSEKSDWEKFCDGLKKVGDWCKEHWKEIMIAIEIIMAVVCFCVPVLQGFGALILENMLKGLIFGLVIGAVVGGISGYAQNGVKGILSGMLNGAKDGALLGAAFGGLGGVGSLSGKLFGCSTFMIGAFSVSSKLAFGMMAFDITALANDFQNRFFQDTGIYLGLVNPYIGGFISDLNHKAHSNSIYNAFQYAVSGMAVFSGGYVKTAACFVAGTLVATVNGLAAIETIKAGDYMLSTDPDTMKTEYKQVLETYIRKVDRLVHLIISGEEIITTVDHPFYVQCRGFIEAGNLLVGDKLVSAIGEDLLIEDYHIEETENLVDVYNLQVEDYHTYHVGKNSVLVHNANYPDNVNKLYDTSKPGKRTKGKTEQRIFNGDFDTALLDFEKLNPTDVKSITTRWGGGMTGNIDKGFIATVRPGSSYGKPTLEIRNPSNGKGLEFRYE